jgi:NAD(P)-dependent dehydrogenase (short-subunit alcohol dehydrogenase family)
VNNAGSGLHSQIVETTETQFDEMVNIHFKKRLLPHAKAPFSNQRRRPDREYFVWIDAIYFPRFLSLRSCERRDRSPYSVFGRGITANVIAPGAIETDFGGGFGP